MLVLKLLPDQIWDIELVQNHDSHSLKKVKVAQTVGALLRDTRNTTEYFYEVLGTAAQLGQPIWVNMAEVQSVTPASVSAGFRAEKIHSSATPRDRQKA